MDDKEIVQMCIEQEAKLQFKHFSNDDAFELGTLMVAEAKAKNLPVAIDISVAGYQLFRHGLAGSSTNNDKWLARKSKMVYYIRKSSLHLAAEHRLIGKDITINWHLNKEEYGAIGGGFPINLEGTGFIGTICVSGLPDFDDHMFLVECLEKYLKV